MRSSMSASSSSPSTPSQPLDDRLLRVARQPAVVVRLAERPAVLGEELRVDRVEDGLVARERPVEVEDQRAGSPHPAQEPTVAAMPLDAFALALGSAFLHALWNLILGRERDPGGATAIALVVSVVVFAPVAALRWDADAEVWPFVAVTSALQLLYFALLATAYATRARLRRLSDRARARPGHRPRRRRHGARHRRRGGAGRRRLPRRPRRASRPRARLGSRRPWHAAPRTALPSRRPSRPTRSSTRTASSMPTRSSTSSSG